MPKPGFLICVNCMKIKIPGNRFKVSATPDGERQMLEHVKKCKSQRA
jgi:hypothetical protein